MEAPWTRGLVDDQHGVALRQRLERIVAHDVAQRVGLPGAAVADRLRAHPPRLAPLRSQQRVQESRRRRHDAWVIDQPTELGLGFPQFGRPKLQKILNRDTGHPILPKIRINREADLTLQL